MDLSGKLVLITGSSGFIGSHVCQKLLKSGAHVRAFVRKGGAVGLSCHKNLEYSTGDLLDSKSLERACENVDAIVHLGGISHSNTWDDEILIDTNIDGTQSLLSAAVLKGVKKFIFISSSLAAAGKRGNKSITDYGNSKLQAEKLVLEENRKGNIDSVVLRPVNVYGQGMRGNIAVLISLISRRLVPKLPELRNPISLVGVDDLCVAIELCLNSDKASGRVYLVTDGEEYTVSGIESGIYRALGTEKPKLRLSRSMVYTGIVALSSVNNLLKFFNKRCPLIQSISLRTYHNLVDESLYDNNEICGELGFTPKSTFYSSLPKILNSR